MSDAPAAPVTENGVPPAAQEKVEETPGFKVRICTALTWHATTDHTHLLQVFAGNLAYVTTDEGLKTFFAPVQADMYVRCRRFRVNEAHVRRA